MPLSAPSVNEIHIRGRYYDVTEFKKHHPGGGIIKFYFNQDATEAFNAFHARSTKAEKYLSMVPSRTMATSGPLISSYQKTDPLVADFEKLRQELYEEGYFNISLWHIAYRILEVVIFHLIGIQLFRNGWIATAIIMLALGQGRSGWLMHEAGHYSLTGKVTLDRILQTIFCSFSLSMSSVYWRNQHNKHHAMPQKLKHDVDLYTLPFVAFNNEIAKHGNPAWLRWQAFTFTPLMTLVIGLGSQWYMNPKHLWRTKQKFELFCCIARYGLIFGVLLRGYTLPQMMALYIANASIVASYFLVNFTLNHTHTPVLPADEQLDWVRFAAYHTVNVEHTLWCNWWMGYLNYQIEHHLFPTMPQFRNQAVAPRVRALFYKHGIPYRVLSYVDALKVSFSNLHTVGQNSVKNSTKISPTILRVPYTSASS